jgi:hypothetical protein
MAALATSCSSGASSRAGDASGNPTDAGAGQATLDAPAPHDWGALTADAAAAVANDGPGGGAAGCRWLSLRGDAYAFELRITTTANFYKVDFPQSSMLHCVGQRSNGASVEPAAMATACEAHYFYKKQAGTAPADTLTESYDVVIPFVPEGGMDLVIAAGSKGSTTYEIRGLDGALWASFTSAQRTFHLAREQMVPGGLANRLPAWPRVGPKRGAYMFPWYGTPTGPSKRWVHWEPDAPTLYKPSKGLYDSADPAVIAQQMAEARSAGLDLFVVSYWDNEDPPLDEYLRTGQAAGIEISAMLETSTRGKGTCRQNVLDQLTLIRERYGSHPAWLKANGSPIVFVYDRVTSEIDAQPVGATGWDDWRWLASQLRPDVPVLMFPLGSQWAKAGAALFGGGFAFAANSGGDSYYTGAHGDDWTWAWTAREQGALLAIPILPSIGRLRSDADAPNYRNQWHAARAVMPDMIIVNSWNEYHESTIIEPTTAFGTQYLQLTADEAGKFCRGELGTLLQ